MTLSKRPYKGTRDLFPKDKRAQDYLFNIMKKTAESFGIEPYDGPLLEEVDLYLAKSGEELINEQIYSFQDRGDRKVAIRPEMTPTLARMVSQTHRETPWPIRWYSIPNLMRYERPQKGRLREHWQFNCDIFGASGVSAEVEIIEILITLLNNYGANDSHFSIKINDRRIVEAFFTKTLGLDQDQSYKLYKVIDRSKKIPQEKLWSQIEEVISCKHGQTLFKAYLDISSFSALQTFCTDNELKNEASPLFDAIDILAGMNYSNYLEFDPTIVRGLDYYTGLVFEAFDKHPDNRRALCGGGAYADLLKIFNEKPIPGVGLGLGDVTLLDFLSVHNLMPSFQEQRPELFMTMQTPEGTKPLMSLAKKLRAQGIQVCTLLEEVKIKKAFKQAEKRQAKLIGLMGSDELEHSGVQIKDQKSGEQLSFSHLDQEENLKKMASKIKEILS